MLEDLLGVLVRSQVGDLRRRTTGALLEGAALGLLGLATVLLFIGAYLGLSTVIEAWLAALLLALVALVAALALMLAGRSLMRRRDRHAHDEILGTLQGLGLLSSKRPPDRPDDRPDGAPGPGLVAAALAAGLVLGRA
ncbi:MAG: phage holin family protein, partial [Paracoccaceae bacterium]|nr:phage holin family protein [Paracoccaceae bacterium]